MTKQFLTGELSWHEDTYLFFAKTFLVGYMEGPVGDGRWRGRVCMQHSSYVDDTPFNEDNRKTEWFNTKEEAQKALVMKLQETQGEERLSQHDRDLKANGYAVTYFTPKKETK